MNTRCGFIATLGRPNAGKSSLLNAIAKQNLALTSHKANATRKQLQIIISHTSTDSRGAYKAQMIFVDTPGIHHQEKLLNQYMLKQSLKAMNDCTLGIYLAPISDDVTHYEEFLALSANTKIAQNHIVVLSKIDLASNEQILAKIAQYQNYQNRYLALIPLSIKHEKTLQELLNVLGEHLEDGVFLYDDESATNANLRDIAKELIRESVFENLSDEVPYQSDVLLERYKEGKIHKIYATIIVSKQSQKALVIGTNAQTIKRIGINAREKLERLLGQKVFLKLEVQLRKGWDKQVDELRKFGYIMD